MSKIRRRDAVGLLTMLRYEAFYSRGMQHCTDVVSAKTWKARARKFTKWAHFVKAVLDSGFAS